MEKVKYIVSFLFTLLLDLLLLIPCNLVIDKEVEKMINAKDDECNISCPENATIILLQIFRMVQLNSIHTTTTTILKKLQESTINLFHQSQMFHQLSHGIINNNARNRL